MFLTAQGGFLGPFAWLLGKLMDLIYNLLAGSNGMANIGVCVILFTVVVKLILFPLTFKQQKSQKINMIIQPEISKIQKKYKDKKDQDSMLKQQQELQAVYDKYGTSMTGGCLTSFIQLPIIYALYRVIQNIPAYVGKVYEMYQPIAQGVMDVNGKKAQQFLIDFVNNNEIGGASYALNKFQKLTEIDVDHVIDVIANFGVSHLNMLSDSLNLDMAANIDKIEQIHSFVLGINISEAPGYKLSWALLIPIASALFQYLSLRVTTSKQPQMEGTSGAMMKGMSIYMPIMSLIITISLPAAIGIYWATSAAITLVTQLIVNVYYDHVDMDKLLEEQMEKAAEKKAKRGDKKSFMERMMDTSAEAEELAQKQAAMKKNSSISLKSYVPSEGSQKIMDEKKNRQYKQGSIGQKANIMMNYNINNNDKEDKK